MNAEHEEAVEFAKISKRENRVYVGNLSYDVKYRDLMEFMRGGGWGNPGLDVFSLCRRGGMTDGRWPRLSFKQIRSAEARSFLERGGGCSCASLS